MDKRLGKPRRQEDITNSNSKIETPLEVPRWAIPRPSLSPSSTSVGDSSISSIKQTKSSSKPRGSNSSQGSSSNHSTQSASSGSLLLSAANLAKVNNEVISQGTLSNYQSNLTAYIHKPTSKPIKGEKIDSESATIDMSTDTGHENHSDPFWNHIKLTSGKHPKHDSMSIASSTHFTVVNGFTRHGKKSKSVCCKSSHQITILVVTMTILLTVGIMAAICYVEMRQRRDTGSRFS